MEITLLYFNSTAVRNGFPKNYSNILHEICSKATVKALSMPHTRGYITL